MQVLKKYWLAIVIAVLLVISGGMIYVKLHPKELPSNLVEGTGRMDGDLVKYMFLPVILTLHVPSQGPDAINDAAPPSIITNTSAMSSLFVFTSVPLSSSDYWILQPFYHCLINGDTI